MEKDLSIIIYILYMRKKANGKIKNSFNYRQRVAPIL